MRPILGNLSYCKVFFIQSEELPLAIFWQVLDVWEFDFVRTRSCILAQSWKCISEFQLCDQVIIQAHFCQGAVQPFPDCFPFTQIVLNALLDEAELCWAFFLACLQSCSTGIYEVGGFGVRSAALHLLVELPEVSQCCVSVEHVTEAFPLLLHRPLSWILLSFLPCGLKQSCLGVACFFLFDTLSPLSACQSTLPEFPCSTRVASCCRFVVWAGLRAHSFDITSVSDLPYLNGCWGFHLGSISGFCRLKTTGRWSLPCDARVSAHIHGASFVDTSAILIGQSVSPCHVPGCVELAVDTGVKRTSLSAASSAHPCWLVPCWSHRLDHALKSLHIMIVSPSSPSISSKKSHLVSVIQVEGRLYGLMKITDLCLSTSFSIRIPSNSRELVDHLFKFSKDTVLLKLLQTTVAIPWPWCLWMTVKPWNTNGRFWHVLVSCRHTTSKL